MNQAKFNTLFRKRTKLLALAVMRFYASLPKNDETRIMGKQLIRCTTSTGANFRAACVARSTRERFSKYCIVVEEADEAVYWLELFDESHLNIKVPKEITQEALEISKVMMTCKTNLRKRL